MKEFFMVLNLNTNYTSYRHENQESAEKEAERLAIQHPGQQFAVLACVGVVKKNEVIWVKPENKNDIPF